MNKTINKGWYWLGGAIMLSSILYSVSSILMPFLVASIVAYGLHPLVSRFEAVKVPRAVSSIFIIVGFFLLFAGMLFIAIPFLIEELLKFAQSLPTYGDRLLQTIDPFINKMAEYVDMSEFSALNDNAANYLSNMLTWVMKTMASMFTNTLALANLISLIILSPVIAFFLLRDWPQIVSNMKELIPKKEKPKITQLFKSINEVLSGYVRGQALVCLAMGTYYAVALSIVGLNYSVTIGLMTGFLAFIPYVGMIIGVLVAVGVALAQFADLTHIIYVAIVFGLGQLLEGTLISPKLIGDRIGLHPVWIIFALLAAGSLFGFIGILLALPLAATFGVLVRFAIKFYRESNFYKGKDPK